MLPRDSTAGDHVHSAKLSRSAVHSKCSGEMGERSHNQVQGLPPPPYDTLHDQGEMIYTAVERLDLLIS